MKQKDLDSLNFVVGAAKASKFSQLDEAETYNAVVVGIAPKTLPFGEVLRWDYELQDVEFEYEDDNGDAQKRVIDGTTSQACTVKSKLYDWYSKIMGKTPDEGEGFSLKEVIGMPCRIRIKNKEGKKKRDDGSLPVFSHVDSVYAAKAGTKSVKKTVKKEVVEVEDDLDLDNAEVAEVEVEVSEPVVKQAPKKEVKKEKKAVVVEEATPVESDDDIDDLFDGIM